MLLYVDYGYIESGYFEGDNVSDVIDVDMSVIEAEFDEVDVSLSVLDSKINSLNSQFVEFASSLASLAVLLENLSSSPANNINLCSLNGNGSEFKDGVFVTVLGRDVVYKVERSYHSLYSDNGYTVHYDLISDDGYKLTVPEALLTKYIEAV